MDEVEYPSSPLTKTITIYNIPCDTYEELILKPSRNSLLPIIAGRRTTAGGGMRFFKQTGKMPVNQMACEALNIPANLISWCFLPSHLRPASSISKS
jgi:hypothetical protein